MNDTRGSGLQPYALAHEWMQDLETRPQHEHKSGISIPRYANDGGEDCESAQHGTIRGYHKYMMDIFMVQQQITGK